jgi:hypothetical protein
MTEQKESASPIISKEEQHFITEHLPKSSLHALGMLSSLRKSGATLEEEWQGAIHEPGNEEHKEGFTQAYEFLKENSDYFHLPKKEK